MLQKAEVNKGIRVEWTAEHRGKDGELISRQVSIHPPRGSTCRTLACLWRYLKDAMLYTLVSNYHARRVAFAEANRHEVILERYRTGEPSPNTLWAAFHANIKLTCPVCRKSDSDPFLGR